MDRLRAPEQVSFDEIGLSFSDEDIAWLSLWVANNAKRQRVSHSPHETTRDSRYASYLSKTPGLLHNPEHQPPERVHQMISEMYDAALGPIAQYLGVTVLPLSTIYAANAHLYLPGDEASEGHVDYYPTVSFCLEQLSVGGDLLVARNTSAKNIDDIRENPYIVHPEPQTLVLFDGCLLPHLVEAVPSMARGVRTTVNTTYWADRGFKTSTRHPRHAYPQT